MGRFQILWFLQAGRLKISSRTILGKNVNRLRNLRGLTQEKLAELVSVDRRYIQRIEQGTANPGVDVIGRLKHALKVEWSELLE